MAYQLISGKSFTQVLFSGQDALPELVQHAADYSVGVLFLLVVCKTLRLRTVAERLPRRPDLPRHVHRWGPRRRGGGLPGMSLAPAIAMGIGAMCAAMLRLPLTSTLLATVLLGSDGFR